ncbi:SanA/YdcF family protein [Psychroserpens sp. BH13MA-6]
MKRLKKLVKMSLLLGALLLVGLIITNKMISHQAESYVYDRVSDIPKNKVGLLLGTIKYLPNGQINLYYRYRIDATVKLFNAGKIDYVLVSGDNGRKTYDEPTTFKKDLMAHGIPEDRIILDYAGFRTLDSVIRSEAIFGQDSITIISQKFHNERAVYLAKHHDISAIAYNAQAIVGSYGLKVQLREYLARAKASLDVLFDVQPKYLGDTIDIP